MITPAHFQVGLALPEYIGLGLVCVTLGHRMSRARQAGESTTLASEFYQCRGSIIKSLRQDLDMYSERRTDILLAGILHLLLADVRGRMLVT